MGRDDGVRDDGREGDGREGDEDRLETNRREGRRPTVDDRRWTPGKRLSGCLAGA